MAYPVYILKIKDLYTQEEALMPFREIEDQKRVKHMLAASIWRRRTAQAYIFQGAAGSGRLAMAISLGQAMLCTGRSLPDTQTPLKHDSDEVISTVDGCGHCAACRQTMHGNHPHFTTIKPDGASVKIDQVRQLKHQLSYQVSEKHPQIYVIVDADRMTSQAANSLLTILEEPQTPSVAVLITENARAILPTLQSRSQVIAFAAVDPDQLENRLVNVGISSDLARIASRMRSGFSAAHQLASDERFAASRKAVVQWSERGLMDPAAALTSLHQYAGQSGIEEPEWLADMMLLWYRDIIRMKTGQEHRVVFSDQAALLKSWASRQNILSWLLAIDRAIALKRRLRQNANPQLALDQLLLDTQEG